MLAARPLWTLTLPDYAPDVRFSPDGCLLAAATVAAPVLVVDPRSGDARFSTEGHPGGALSVAWCVTHRLLATGGADGTVALHGAGDGAPRVRVSLGRGWVERLLWSPDGEVLAAAVGRSACFVSPDGTVRGRFDGHPSTVTGLAWHATRRAWLTSAYGVVSLLDPDQPEPLTQHYFRTSMLTVHPSPDGRFVASGTQDPLVHVWDLDDETNEVNLTGYAGKVSVLAWSPARALLATGAGAGVVLWDFTGGDPFRTRPRELKLGGTGRVTALEFLRTGELLTGTDTGVVWCIELDADGAEVARAIVARVSGTVCSLMPAPDGSAVAVVSTGGGVALLGLAVGA
jgi:WD40 repeat protein